MSTTGISRRTSSTRARRPRGTSRVHSNPRWHDSRAIVAVVIASVLCLHLAYFLLVVPGLRTDIELRGTLWLFYRDSGRTLSGAIPYRDFLFEYPPGALIFMILPRVLAVGPLTYRLWFFVQVALLDVVVLLTLSACARRMKRSITYTLTLYTVAIVSLGPVVAYRVDLAPAAIALLAVLAWSANRPLLVAILLAAGTATKVYPLALLPLVVIDQWRAHDLRHARRTIATFVAALVIFVSPAVLAGAGGIAETARFQTHRHLQIESIWAMPPLLWHLIAHYPLHVTFSGRAQAILGPGDAAFGQFGMPVLCAVLLAVYWRWWRLCARRDRHQHALSASVVAVTLATAILSKVLSPQYLIWVIPPLCLMPVSRPLSAISLLFFIFALPLTLWIYPLHYGELTSWLSPTSVAVLALRNGMLVMSLAALVASLYQSATRARHPARRSRRVVTGPERVAATGFPR